MRVKHDATKLSRAVLKNGIASLTLAMTSQV
jgi:hypothetical protein